MAMRGPALSPSIIPIVIPVQPVCYGSGIPTSASSTPLRYLVAFVCQLCAKCPVRPSLVARVTWGARIYKSSSSRCSRACELSVSPLL
ncbi:hypothetical protein PENSPDRAFT_321239 [Peniophora sp. CONT]|nr:hypothetical protein PENSPDRAFT_321239 [Peniophora sp. CONT]